ncbi:Vacuolar membrane protein [Mycena venus]|uniref:Vacuolar membrane protein n=1 Tax=Mycena venus TaxID=2733690 RepID=A0A8H6XFM5_9AGAR|nr:Vacuolar membrane protein [Mycena venus]
MAALTLARAYQYSFDTRPHTTLAVTGGCLNALGDVVAQVSHNILRQPHDERKPFDPTRTLRFFVFGASISPFLGRWNGFLERQFPLRALNGTGKVSPKALAKRVAADQIVMAPIGLVAFIGSMGILEGRSRKQISQKYSDMFMPTLRTNWSVWPVLQFVNFRFMPLPYRVPFQSTCGVFWTLYLSTVNAGEDRKQDRATAMQRTLG